MEKGESIYPLLLNVMALERFEKVFWQLGVLF